MITSQANNWAQIWDDIVAQLQSLVNWEALDLDAVSNLQLMLSQDWFFSGVFVLFGFPIALLIITELLHWLQKNHSPWLFLAQQMRNWLIPSFFAYVLFSHVLDLAPESGGIKLVLTLFWVVFIYSILKLLDTLIFTDKSPLQLQKQIPKLLIDFLRLFLVLLGAAFVLSKVWHLDLGRLLTALSVGSLVLGLALQNVMGSLFSGVALLSSRPFSVGDWIKIKEIEGKITSMDWRAVSLENRQGDRVVIPNAMIAEEIFYNYSQPTRLHVESIRLVFSHKDAPNQVKSCLIAAALATKHILKQPKPWVKLDCYDDIGIVYLVNYVIDDYKLKPYIYNDFISRIWYISRRYQVHLATNSRQISEQNPAEPENLLQELQKLRCLDLPVSEWQQLLEHAKVEIYGNNEIILQQGELAPAFYIILDGLACEFIQANEKLSTLHRGDFIGTASMIRHTPSRVSVQVIEDVRVLAVDTHTMYHILQHHVHIAQHLENLVEIRENRIKKILENHKS